MSQYSCKHVGIRANLSRARIWALCEHDFGLSILSFDLAQVTKLWYRLDNEPRVGTPLHRNLLKTNQTNMNDPVVPFSTLFMIP